MRFLISAFKWLFFLLLGAAMGAGMGYIAGQEPGAAFGAAVGVVFSQIIQGTATPGPKFPGDRRHLSRRTTTTVIP